MALPVGNSCLLKHVKVLALLHSIAWELSLLLEKGDCMLFKYLCIFKWIVCFIGFVLSFEILKNLFPHFTLYSDFYYNKVKSNVLSEI